MNQKHISSPTSNSNNGQQQQQPSSTQQGQQQSLTTNPSVNPNAAKATAPDIKSPSQQAAEEAAAHAPRCRPGWHWYSLQKKCVKDSPRLDINAAKATNTPDPGGPINEQLRPLLHHQQVILQQQHLLLYHHSQNVH
jgi:hypothetical protein